MGAEASLLLPALPLGTWDDFSRFLKQSVNSLLSFLRVAPERSFLSTDLGQVHMPDPIDGMLHAVQALEKAGASASEIDTWIKHVPARLLSIDGQ